MRLGLAIEGCAEAARRAVSADRLLGQERGNLLGDLGEILVSCKDADCAKPWQKAAFGAREPVAALCHHIYTSTGPM